MVGAIERFCFAYPKPIKYTFVVVGFAGMFYSLWLCFAGMLFVSRYSVEGHRVHLWLQMFLIMFFSCAGYMVSGLGIGIDKVVRKMKAEERDAH